jgi:hypothetical protein
MGEFSAHYKISTDPKKIRIHSTYKIIYLNLLKKFQTTRSYTKISSKP